MRLVENTTSSSPLTPLDQGTILSIQSHVAYGHAGNSSAVFPMQRLGYNVIDINTVSFSNHTGYGDWGGTITPIETIKDIISGVERRGVFPTINAVISGYMGDASIGDTILETVDAIKLQNNGCVYICDPVFGDTGRGIFVKDGILEYFRDYALPKADVCTPNLFELQHLTDGKIDTLENIVQSARILIDRGTKIVFVTSVEHNESKENTLEILAVTHDKSWRVVTPKININCEPSGSGDATTAILTCNLLDGKTIEQALKYTASSMYYIFQNTAIYKTKELQIIASGDDIVHPPHLFETTELSL